MNRSHGVLRAALSAALLIGAGKSPAADGGAPAHRIIPIAPMHQDVEVLSGDPEKPGEPFVIRIREVAGTTVPPHSHPVDEHITVVSGTWYFAIGDEFDPKALREMPVGSYAFAPKGSTMFAASPEAAIVQVHGIGPFHIHWKHGFRDLENPKDAASFRFRVNAPVRGKRGPGIVRRGWASGTIIQYEVEQPDGTLFMENEADLAAR